MVFEDKIPESVKKCLTEVFEQNWAGVTYRFWSPDKSTTWGVTGRACHASIADENPNVQDYDYIANQHFCNNEDREHIQKYIFSDSPWSRAKLWENTDFNSVKKYGFITSFAQPDDLFGSACMASKGAAEGGTDQVLPLFKALIKAGLTADMAYFLFLNTYSFQTNTKSKAVYIAGRGHQNPFVGARYGGDFGDDFGASEQLLRHGKITLFSKSDRSFKYRRYYLHSREVMNPSSTGVNHTSLIEMNRSILDHLFQKNGSVQTKENTNPFRPTTVQKSTYIRRWTVSKNLTIGEVLYNYGNYFVFESDSAGLDFDAVALAMTKLLDRRIQKFNKTGV